MGMEQEFTNKKIQECQVESANEDKSSTQNRFLVFAARMPTEETLHRKMSLKLS